MPTRNRRARATRRPAARASGGSLEIAVGRFGSEPVTVTVTKGSTVGAVLKKADIVLGSSERVWLNGSASALTDKVKRGDIVSIVSPREAGKV